MNKKEELDSRYMRMARIWAENSYCKRRQVGALMVKNNMIISAHALNSRRSWHDPLPVFCCGMYKYSVIIIL